LSASGFGSGLFAGLGAFGRAGRGRRGLGEEVGATVHGAPGLTEAALRSFLAEHLARHEIPRYFRILDEPLPRTASGKILKRELRSEAVAALA